MRLAQQPADDDRLAASTASTEYALEGSVFIGGAVVQWLRDGLKHHSRRRPTSRRWRARVAGQRRRVFRARVRGLGAPHWDAYARGAIFGLTRGTTGGHFARAALESRSRTRAPTCSTRWSAMPASRCPSCASTAARPQRPADAVPGRPARRPGRAAEGHARRRRSAPPISPGSPSATGRAPTT